MLCRSRSRKEELDVGIGLAWSRVYRRVFGYRSVSATKRTRSAHKARGLDRQAGLALQRFSLARHRSNQNLISLRREICLRHFNTDMRNAKLISQFIGQQDAPFFRSLARDLPVHGHK